MHGGEILEDVTLQTELKTPEPTATEPTDYESKINELNESFQKEREEFESKLKTQSSKIDELAQLNSQLTQKVNDAEIINYLTQWQVKPQYMDKFVILMGGKLDKEKGWELLCQLPDWHETSLGGEKPRGQ